MTIRQPVGVCGIIALWNFPLAMIARRLGPAIAAGCTAVVKLPREAPLCTLAIVGLVRQAGIPANVIQVVPTSDRSAVEELYTHPDIKKISFTGSTGVGKLIREKAARTMKRTSMELGGLAPLIVFDDADLEAVGKVKSRIDDALGKDARLLHGGNVRADLGGFFIEPALLDGVTQDMAVAHGETFGALAAVVAFDTVEDVIRMASDTEYGLASYFFSRDIDIKNIWGVEKELDVGIVGVNTGKISGYSRRQLSRSHLYIYCNLNSRCTLQVQ
ncbi:hypothetical protein ACJ41O_015389 [Fusarium nematophilum]